MSQNNLRSQSLDLLRFPLAIVVVTVHMFSARVGLDGSQFNADAFPVFRDVCIFIRAFLAGISVPIYFFISGYVFFVNVDELTTERYLQKLKNRIHTLLIPYVLWTSLEIILMIVKQLPIFGGYLTNADAELDLSLKGLLSCFWYYNGALMSIPGAVVETGNAYPLVFPLWFLRDLMVVVLFTPVLYWMIRRFRIWFLVFLGILLFLPSWMGLRFEFLAKAFFFFSFGAYMSISRKDMILSFRSFFKWSLALYPLLGVLYIVVMDFSEVARVVKLLNTFAALFLAYNLAAWLLEKSYVKVNPFIAGQAFSSMSRMH